MRITTYLLAVLLFATGVSCYADEDYCGEIAPEKLEFHFASISATRTTLVITLPLRDGKAKFHKLGISVGEAADKVSFDLKMEEFEGSAIGLVHLPRPHKIVHVEAIYSQGRCFKQLKAIFVNEKRVAEPAESNS